MFKVASRLTVSQLIDRIGHGCCNVIWASSAGGTIGCAYVGDLLNKLELG